MSSKTATEKVTAPQNEAESGSNAVHRMRITSGGSIQAYVTFALKHLQDPQTPLVLHTVPPPPSDLPLTKAKWTDATAPEAESSTTKATKPRTTTLHSCTLTTPRLISVVELIKRDYLVGLAASGKGKGKHRATGLWQYTESGLFPDTSGPVATNQMVEEDGVRVEALKRVLEGSTKPKMTHRPYLQITLSTRPLGLESQKNVTCQYVLGRRNRKGKKNGSEATADETDTGNIERDVRMDGAAENSATKGARKDEPTEGAESNVKEPGKKRKAPQTAQEQVRAKRKRENGKPAKNA